MKLNGDVYHLTDFPEIRLANESNRRPRNYANRLPIFRILFLAFFQGNNDLRS